MIARGKEDSHPPRRGQVRGGPRKGSGLDHMSPPFGRILTEEAMHDAAETEADVLAWGESDDLLGWRC